MLMDFCVPTLRVVVPWSYLSSKRGLMPQIDAANFMPVKLSLHFLTWQGANSF